MAEKNTVQLTPEEETRAKVLKFKRNAELYIVGVIYQKPDLLPGYSDLQVKDFDDPYCKVFFAVAVYVLKKKQFKSLNKASIESCLISKPELKKLYEKYGAWESIQELSQNVSPANLDAYVSELIKWQCVLNLSRNGIEISGHLSDFVDMSQQQIYNECLARVDDAFANSPELEEAYNVFEGSYELIEETNAGINVGMPFSNATLLTEEVAGFNLNGHIYGLGACSGVGKSTMAFNYLIPSAFEHNEKVAFIINEESHQKFFFELVIWVANNIFAKSPEEYIHKKTLREGNLDDITKKRVSQSIEWIQSKKQKDIFNVIPLERYSVKGAINVINKYSRKGIRLFVIDTFKESYDANTDATHRSMARDMTALHDVIKSSNRNVGLFVTYQLSKGSIKKRHLTNDEIGLSKSIVDVMSVNFMMRRPYDSEYQGGRKAIKCWREEDGRKIEFYLQRDKQYMITFIAKNRFGRTDEVQIVSECDLGTNVHRDIGYCQIPHDLR